MSDILSGTYCKYLPVQCPSSRGRLLYIHLLVMMMMMMSPLILPSYIYTYRPYIYTGIAASVGHVKSFVIYTGIAASVGLVKSQLVRPSQLVSNKKKIPPKNSSTNVPNFKIRYLHSLLGLVTSSAHFNLNFPGSTGLF